MTSTVTKSELIERISEKLKLPNGKAEQIVNCVFDSMVKALQDGDGIEIRGFGSFTVREYKAYEGRNPRTGETVHVAPKRLPFFKVGKDLRERVNQAYQRELAREAGGGVGVGVGGGGGEPPSGGGGAPPTGGGGFGGM
jgi:integration host factor subunit beta